MKIKKQPAGTPLTESEQKELTALLVKLGYTVKISREKLDGKSVSQKVIEAVE